MSQIIRNYFIIFSALVLFSLPSYSKDFTIALDFDLPISLETKNKLLKEILATNPSHSLELKILINLNNSYQFGFYERLKTIQSILPEEKRAFVKINSPEYIQSLEDFSEIYDQIIKETPKLQTLPTNSQTDAIHYDRYKVSFEKFKLLLSSEFPQLKKTTLPPYPFNMDESGWLHYFIRNQNSVDPIQLYPKAMELLKERILPPEPLREFLNLESLNSYKAKGTIRKTFQPSPDNIFPIFYADIPNHALEVVQTNASFKNLLPIQVSENKTRFLIHPESVKLYSPLLNKLGLSLKSYLAQPTSSTRSMLIWDEYNSFFAKISLAKMQDGLGRIVPSWEIRRSIGISDLVQLTPQEEWSNHRVQVLPEVTGVYVKEKNNLIFRVDENQPRVTEHGYILRDPSIISNLSSQPNTKVMPLFALFTKRAEEEPLIINLFKASTFPKTSEGFVSFIDDFLFKPVVEQNGYLFFKQGIIPEIHSQNLLVVMDTLNKKIISMLHRDVGSMKVDLKLRWVNGLPISPLMYTKNAAFDFKFERAPQLYEEMFMDYFHHFLFEDYREDLKGLGFKVDTLQTKKKLKERLRNEVQKWAPLPDGPLKNIEAHMKLYVANQSPTLKMDESKLEPLKKHKNWVQKQIQNSQWMKLPNHWKKDFNFSNENIIFTQYGAVLKPEDHRKPLQLIFYDQNPSKIQVNLYQCLQELPMHSFSH